MIITFDLLPKYLERKLTAQVNGIKGKENKNNPENNVPEYFGRD